MRIQQPMRKRLVLHMSRPKLTTPGHSRSVDAETEMASSISTETISSNHCGHFISHVRAEHLKSRRGCAVLSLSRLLSPTTLRAWHGRSSRLKILASHVRRDLSPGDAKAQRAKRYACMARQNRRTDSPMGHAETSFPRSSKDGPFSLNDRFLRKFGNLYGVAHKVQGALSTILDKILIMPAVIGIS